MAKLLAAATCALALLFTQPACFTAMTWRDDRSWAAVAEVEAPELRAFLVGDPGNRRAPEPTRLVLQVPEALRGALQAVAPASAPATEWIEVEPLEHAHTVIAVLAVQSATRDARATLDVVEEPNGVLTLRLRCRARTGFPGVTPTEELGRHLPGFCFDFGLYFPYYDLDVPCRTTPRVGEPEATAHELRAFAVRHVRYRDDGTPLVTKLVLTPLAVAGDLLLSPFELLWWLSV
jgi:hypothetical protein